MNVNTIDLTPEEAKAILADGRLILASREEVEVGQAAIAENERLRAEVERLRVDLAVTGARQDDALRTAEAAEALLAGLRGALEEVHEGASRQLAEPRNYDNDQYALTAIATTCELALARTPDQHRARIEAAGLREAARKMREGGALNAAYHAISLESEADRMERGE